MTPIFLIQLEQFTPISHVHIFCLFVSPLVQVQRGMLVCRNRGDGKPWLTQKRFAHLRTRAEEEMVAHKQHLESAKTKATQKVQSKL